MKKYFVSYSYVEKDKGKSKNRTTAEKIINRQVQSGMTEVTINRKIENFTAVLEMAAVIRKNNNHGQVIIINYIYLEEAEEKKNNEN